MATPVHLSRAPVAEAIIDIQVVTRAGVQPQSIRNAFAHLGSTFPTQKDWKAMRASFTTGPDVLSHSREDLGLQGVLLTSEDEKLIVRATVDGLTLSRLKPYTSWANVLSTFLSLWDAYAASAEPQAVKRAAVRYINRLELPGAFDLTHILDIPIEIPPAFGGQLVGYLSRYVIESDPALAKATATLTIAIEPGPSQGTSTMIFDSDCVAQSPAGVDRAAIEATLNSLGQFKNRLFFGSFTDKALEDYR
jgi:uncharacterized protein (TIGR04255 family)